MSDGAVVAFDIGVLLGLAGLDVLDSNPMLLRPFHQLFTDVFGAIACWERRAVKGYGCLRSLKNSAAGGHNRVSGLYGGFANHTTEETGYGQG